MWISKTRQTFIFPISKFYYKMYRDLAEKRLQIKIVLIITRPQFKTGYQKHESTIYIFAAEFPGQ